jgi:membrane protease YdiL (CAAX protease family)
VVALVPALCEELLFRGLVQRSFEEVTPGIRGAVIAGLIFGAYHLNPFALVPVAALGVYLGFIVYRAENISVAISTHFFNNFIACTAAYLKIDDDVVVLAPGGMVTPSVLVMNYGFFAVVFVLATYYFIRVTERAEEPEH